MHGPLLVVHVLAGTLGLGAGVLAALARKWRGLHTVAGWTYQVCCAVLCTSAVGLVVLDASLWPFLLLAVPTEVAAVLGVVVRRRRRPGWIPVHVQLLLGSYVSFVTALCVQLTDGALLGWLIPVVIGSTVINVVVTRLKTAGARSARRATAATAA